MVKRDLARLKRRLKAIPERVQARAEAALVENAAELTRAMRRLVPVEDGTLRDSIRFRDVTTPAQIQVLVTAGDEEAFYARMVEFGTPNQSASPFFYPTYRSLKKRLRGRLSRAISKAAKEAAAKP